MDNDRVEQISQEAFSLLDTGRQVAPFTVRYDGFGLMQAYEVVARVRELRETRGEQPIGRKIGFTNRAVWSGLGISAPIWGYVYDRTVHDGSAETTFELGDLPEPRLEPELVLHLRAAPAPGMSESQLFGCLDWVAAGYEIVYSVFPAGNSARLMPQRLSASTVRCSSGANGLSTALVRS